MSNQRINLSKNDKEVMLALYINPLGIHLDDEDDEQYYYEVKNLRSIKIQDIRKSLISLEKRKLIIKKKDFFTLYYLSKLGYSLMKKRIEQGAASLNPKTKKRKIIISERVLEETSGVGHSFSTSSSWLTKKEFDELIDKINKQKKILSVSGNWNKGIINIDKNTI